MKKVLVALLVLSFLAGCGAGNRKGLLAAGYSAQYVDGYIDGYAAGCSLVGHPLYQFTRDVSRYEQDRQYMSGWNTGFSIARTDSIAVR